MRGALPLAASLLTLFSSTLAISQPERIYGVNLGSWLLVEPWMLPDEWVAMGGELCDNCAECIKSEFALTQAYPDTADQIFDEHWQTWFTKADAYRLKALGINTIRIPLGYWLVEPLVEEGEFYPKGGMRRLREGLEWLNEVGMAIILDHHALPGVSSENQMFAGRCTSDVQFYTPKNYHRALIWTAVMTFFSHLDPTFKNVFSIQAINEPIMDSSRTPGYGQFQKDFVQTVRAVEDILGAGSEPDYRSAGNITSTLQKVADVGSYSDEVKSVLKDSIPVLLQMALKYGSPTMLHEFFRPGKDALTTNFMDKSWQWSASGMPPPSNPADAKDGPQAYDNHLYFSFGGVAPNNTEGYMDVMCNLKRVEKAAAAQNIPLWFGEWSLATGFKATDEFIKQWADAQKLQYEKSAGWIFWNFKLEDSESAGGLQNQWSYYKGIELGYLTEDPAAYHDPNVCVPWINSTKTA